MKTCGARIWRQRSLGVAQMATGTPARTVGYVSAHSSMDFARSFLARTEQVTDSVHSSPACWALSSTEMEGGIFFFNDTATTESHSFWVIGWSSTRLNIRATGRSSGGGEYPISSAART